MKRKGILIGIITVAVVAIVGLSVGLGLSVRKSDSYKIELENLYRKSYFETMDSINDIETKLNKLSVTGGNEMKKELLREIWRECEMAESNLSQLSSRDQAVNNIIRLINQLGDYSFFLSAKLDGGEGLDSTENGHLNSFYEQIVKVRTSLSEVRDSLYRGGSLMGEQGAGLNYFDAAFAAVTHDSVDYPELIYDGPFSDGLNDRTPKYLEGEGEITAEEGRQRLSEYLFCNIEAIEYVGENGGNIPCFVYSVREGEGGGSAQISKNGGKLVLYNAYTEIASPTLTEEECAKKAEYFANHLGYEDMKAVWVSNNNSTVYVNLAYIENDIIVYPDLVKIKIAADTGKVLGVEAQNYIYNHTERRLSVPEELEITTIEGGEVLTSQWALIPTDWNDEILTKELQIEKEGTTYFIYVNPETREEEKILIVVDENGKLLM